jgi:hypothetical protein
VRPYLLAVALLAGVAVPTAADGGCVAFAHEPEPVNGALVLASGVYECDGGRTGMTVTVCVESLRPLESLSWRVEGCSTDSAPGSTSILYGATFACVLGGPLLVRAYAAGANDAGEESDDTSDPAWAPGAGSCGP